MFYLVAWLVLCMDQLFKYLITRSIPLGQSIPAVPKILKLTLVQNTGAAFSLFTGLSSYLAVIGIIISVLVIYFHYRVSGSEYLLQTGLALILGGSLGNLIDRLFRGGVIDYLDISPLINWPVFNFADILINLGVFLIMLRILMGGDKNATSPI